MNDYNDPLLDDVAYWKNRVIEEKEPFIWMLKGIEQGPICPEVQECLDYWEEEFPDIERIFRIVNCLPFANERLIPGYDHFGDYEELDFIAWCLWFLHPFRTYTSFEEFFEKPGLYPSKTLFTKITGSCCRPPQEHARYIVTWPVAERWWEKGV
ncbi:hypothetical protein GSS88_06895, partial [Corynebacterium sp. 3HC-13]